MTSDATQTKSFDQSVREFLRSARAHWPSILICTLIGLLGSSAWALLQPNVYQTTAVGQVVVSSGDSSLGMAMAGDSLAKSRATQYKALAESPSVARRVVSTLKLDRSPENLLMDVNVAVPLDTAQLTVTARASTPELAATLANEWVKSIAAEAARLENGGTAPTAASPSANGPATSAIKVVEASDATVPQSPVSPNLKVALAIGALAGLVVGLVQAQIRSIFDRRIRSAETVESDFGVPVVGLIPESSRMKDDHRLSSDSFDQVDTSNFRVTEAFKELRTNIQFMNPDSPVRVITVTSALPGDGKSSVADNLALALSSHGEPVFLLDGDLRRPTVAKTFGLVESVGLTDVIVGRATLEEVLQEVEQAPSLRILASGPIPPNPTEILSSDRFRRLVEELSAVGYVIIDAPPVLPITDAAILAANFDGALVVAQVGKTTNDALRKALENIERINGEVLGVVLNRIPVKGARAGYYRYYGENYYYGENKEEKSKRKPKKSPKTS